MSSLFAIVQQYRGRLSLLAVLVFLFVVATLLLYLLFPKQSLLKYLPMVLGFMLGIAFLIHGISIKATIEGLEWIWKGICFFVAACISLAAAWMTILFRKISGQ